MAAAAVVNYSLEDELEAIRLQESELQAQQDAIFAERLALALSLGANVEGNQFQGIEDAILHFGVDVPGVGDLSQVANQLAELRAAAGQLVAESLQDSFVEQERADRDSVAAAAALEAQERWHAQVVRHDAGFARKLASMDAGTWEEIGDQFEEPLNLPLPVGAPAANSAAPAGPSSATPQNFRPTPPPSSSATRSAAKLLPLSLGSGPGPSRLPGTSTSGAGAGPSSQPQRSVGLSCGTINCLSCFDTFSEREVMCAGADGASSSSASAGCGHYFCNGCMAEYVRGAIQEHKFPIVCPMAPGGGGQQQGQQQGQRAGQQEGCRCKLSRDSVLGILQGHPKEQELYQLLEAESSLDPSQLLYCPHLACSSPLLLADQDLEPNQPATCPACLKVFCPKCRVPGWHQGYTCAAFQALPAHLRSAEDAAMLKLSKQQRWRRCPQCKLMVERASGCNHMLCRCGSNFCYACGKPYKDTRPTAGNVHGTPSCGCQLFDVPAEVGDDDEAAGGADAVAAPSHEASPRPFRGGRLVSRTRCRFSGSIYDCPRGLGRCWFWHDEDDNLDLDKE